MYSILRNIMKYFISQNKIEYEKELKKQLEILDEETKEESSVTSCEIQSKKFTQEECFSRIGVITSIQSNYGVIDDKYVFNVGMANKTSENLQVGFRVKYLAFKTHIIKIESILSDMWEDEESSGNYNNSEICIPENEIQENFDTHQRSVLGTIRLKTDNAIEIDTDYDKVVLDLKTFPMKFPPKQGDKVLLNCKIQTDTSFVDSVGEILEVLDIFPSRSKTISSFITKVHESWGVIGHDYFFTFDILPFDYKPNEGDKVSADVVESENDKFIWRCTRIIPLVKSAGPPNHQSSPNFELDFFSNKNGIIVSDDIHFSFTNLREEKCIEIVIKNDGESPRKIVKLFFMGKKSESQLELIEPKAHILASINAKESYSIILRGKSKFYGISEEIFVISFDGFKIGRKIKIDVRSCDNDKNSTDVKNICQNLKRNGLHSLEVWTKKYTLVPGEGITQKARFVAKRMRNYPVPDKLKTIVLGSQNRISLLEDLEEMYPYYKEQLSPYNYARKFEILLYLEEIEYFQSMRKYDLERAHFIHENEFLALEIENLAEKRPSLVIGDSIRATNPWDKRVLNRYYEGVIHKVLGNRILLKFNSDFHTQYNGEDYKLEFFYSRSSFRKQHYAINKVFYHTQKEILFPNEFKIQQGLQLDVNLNENYNLVINNVTEEKKWFNSNLNSIQKLTIMSVLRGEKRPMPYIIFGPPGTGKTLTLVEIVLQLTKLLPDSRLLIGTPSNSSADLIATRLIDSKELQPGDFVRLVSHNLVEKEMIPDHLKSYCATIDIACDGTSPNSMIKTDSGLRLKCQTKHLGNHRITIGTCITLGTLLQLNFPKGHFTHLLIDEAGQCTEPETMICVSLLDKSSTQIILTGDPLQLGPIILNKYASDAGLETSLLTRILTCAPYKKNMEKFPKNGGYDPCLVTKLIYNYRSIPSILRIFSDLFYDSELKSRINEFDSKEIALLKSLQDIFPSSKLRSLNHGVFFVGVNGENFQDSDSPSWYNAVEAKKVFQFLQQLYKKQINTDQIGIITPYQKQVRTIRNILIATDSPLPKIGSVEEFQGKERDIILISTVRSSKSFIEADLKHTLGFVQSSKRMNVAISRSRSLLVIFGNPHLLSLDANWKKLIQYCISNDAYIGSNVQSELL